MNATPAPASWNDLHEDLQLVLARSALQHAAGTLASHAEAMAEYMEEGALLDLDGAGALRLFSEVIRSLHREDFPTVGNA